jgi:hypothetical protein
VNEVPFRHGERIGFSYLVSQKYTGESARVRILRESKIKECDIHLANHNRLVPAHIKGKPPAYYILAGIVFAAISVPYLRSEVGTTPMFSLMFSYMNNCCGLIISLMLLGSREMDSFKQISVIPGPGTLGFHDSMKCMTKSCFGNLLFLWSIMVY